MRASSSSTWVPPSLHTAIPFFGRTFISASHFTLSHAHGFAITGTIHNPSSFRRRSNSGTSRPRMNFDVKKFAVTSRIARRAPTNLLIFGYFGERALLPFGVAEFRIKPHQLLSSFNLTQMGIDLRGQGLDTFSHQSGDTSEQYRESAVVPVEHRPRCSFRQHFSRHLLS